MYILICKLIYKLFRAAPKGKQTQIAFESNFKLLFLLCRKSLNVCFGYQDSWPGTLSHCNHYALCITALFAICTVPCTSSLVLAPCTSTCTDGSVESVSLSSSLARPAGPGYGGGRAALGPRVGSWRGAPPSPSLTSPWPSLSETAVGS